MERITRSRSQADHEEADVMDDQELQAAQEAARANLDEIDLDEVDSLLEEIDDVLEKNATGFISGFVQVNGQ
ncbi:MAG: Pup-like protein [Candidatus Saccharibacteria bacterium]|nr:Pup-like protein [Candidatus Saccharibacteria bacterium]